MDLVVKIRPDKTLLCMTVSLQGRRGCVPSREVGVGSEEEHAVRVRS